MFLPVGAGAVFCRVAAMLVTVACCATGSAVAQGASAAPDVVRRLTDILNPHKQ
jgi:hypothetical protein